MNLFQLMLKTKLLVECAIILFLKNISTNKFYNMKAKNWIIEKKIKLTKVYGEKILPVDYACGLMDLFAAEKTKELLKMVVKLKEICENEIPEFNIPELNEIINEENSK